jgi:hypothetical protein
MLTGDGKLVARRFGSHSYGLGQSLVEIAGVEDEGALTGLVGADVRKMRVDPELHR